MTNKLFGVTKEQAIQKANDLAKKQGYASVELVNEAFTSSEVPGQVYLFYVINKDPSKTNQIEYTGLPLCIAVDKITGESYEVRTLF
ncbi:hypothetical protein [Lactobacillus crispatus]|uniref:hypothetical protein n=1 Tax=Lactobacillus crispatus TaxID=47770 RepID=UPI0018AA311E|nr:hypothetical protein [Lactobacillus crispatus]